MLKTGDPVRERESASSSMAERKPRFSPPTFPVALAAPRGEAIRRVCTRGTGVSKFSFPSRKKGRFSGKKSAARGSVTTCPTSASTCEKSGFAVRFTVRLVVTPQRTFPPISGSGRP
jgi:hypothetical protein